MPNYNYVCTECDYTEERFGFFSKMKKQTYCPKCKTQTFIRCVGTGGGLIFKGSGFYQTDVVHQRDAKMENRRMNKEDDERRREENKGEGY